MKRHVLKGATDVTLEIFIQDSTSTTGAGKTGLAYNTASLTCYYHRSKTAAAQLTLATQTVTGAHSDGGFVEVDGTNLPGVYRLDLSDAIVASGVDSVVVILKGATGMAPLVLELQLVAYNPNDSVRLGLTALPNAAADAAGGLPISDAGGLDLDARIGTDIPAILVDTGTTLQGELDGIQADTEDIQSRLPAALTAGGNIKADALAVSGDTTAADTLELFAEALDQATGQLDSGSLASGTITAASIAADAITDAKVAADVTIASVTGAVGSVTGNVGGNVTGSVGSLAAQAKADVNAEADTALADYDGPTYTELLNLIRVALRKDAALATDLSALITSVNADLGSGGGAYANTTDAQEAIRDNMGTAQTGDAYARLGAPAGASVSADIAAVKAETADILIDTAEIGAAGAGLTAINLPDQTMNITGDITGNLSGSVGSVTGNVGGNVTGSVGSLAAQAKADVNAEVLDVLNTDTFAEPTGVPAATSTLATKLGWLFMALRNKVTITATKKTFYDDGDAAEWEKDLSDDGSTYQESEGNSV